MRYLSIFSPLLSFYPLGTTVLTDAAGGVFFFNVLSYSTTLLKLSSVRLNASALLELPFRLPQFIFLPLWNNNAHRNCSFNLGGGGNCFSNFMTQLKLDGAGPAKVPGLGCIGAG